MGVQRQYPPRLHPGDTLRVVAPARSLAMIGPEAVAVAEKRLQAMGFTVTYGRHVWEDDRFRSTTVAARVEDLHDAFAAPDVQGILTVIGGWNSNQLLRHLDYDLIAAHPKILCGYSDITALGHAIVARTGLVTYSGPHFSTFGMVQGFDYTEASFRLCLMATAPYEIRPAPRWSDDAWWLDQTQRHFEANPGPWVLQPGHAQGTVIGGNLCTLNLLQGTPYLPSLEDTVLFVEDDDQAGEFSAVDFDRNLQSLLHLPDARGIRAVVIGRFQRGSAMSPDTLGAIIASKPELRHVPVVAGVDFGHTFPLATFPIGGTATLTAAADGHVTLRIDGH